MANVRLTLDPVIDRATLTATLAARYRGLGRNMPQTAAQLLGVLSRMLRVLGNGGLTAEKRAGLNVLYRGKMFPAARGTNVVGGLAPEIEFRFGEDGVALTVTSLETCLVRLSDDEYFVVKQSPQRAA